jgi:hypothetical protein
VEQEEDKRPDPPVVAVLVPVVVWMTEAQAAQFAEDCEFDDATPAGVAACLLGAEVSGPVAEALKGGQRLSDGITVTVLDAEPFPVGEPFPGFEDGYVTGLCAHRVARSEWAAGFRTCERCHGVTVSGQ